MADTTYSVKISEEDQERLKNLVGESGMSSKEFFTNLLSIYELQRAKELAPIITADVEELETLTRRINGIFVNVAERVNTLQRDTAEQMRQAQDTNTGTIELLQQRISGLEEERLQDEQRIQGFISDKELAESRTDELQHRIKDMEAAAVDKQALIDQYKEKLDTQTGIVNEYKQAADEAKAIQRENNELEAKIKEQQAQLDALGLERDRQVIELERQHTRELQALQAEYSGKLNEYESTVRGLLDQLQGKPAPASKPKTSRKKADTDAGQGDPPPTE